VSDAVLDDLLNEQALFYIGPSRRIEQYNRNNNNKFEQINLVFSKKGFVRSEPMMGSYATYICNRKDKLDKTLNLVSFLLSEEGSRMTMLGIEGKHWLEDDKQNLIRFPDTDKKMLENDYTLTSITGIAAFPYLSSIGSVYPALRKIPGITTRDLIEETRQCWFDPTASNDNVPLFDQKYVIQLYKNILSNGDMG